MNEEALNLSIRRFLKTVGIGSHEEMQKAIAKAVADGVIAGNETFPAKMTLEIPGLGFRAVFEGNIELQ
jgi:hypothetical protein